MNFRVLVACEYSGRVRDAFARNGCDAWSCDFEPAETPGKHHQGDVRDLLGDPWDLLIAHPPCTFLCSSGMHWTTRGKRDPRLTDQAMEFVLMLAGQKHISRKAIENPIGCLSTRWRKPDQIIQPWMFGHPESKATCLWLENLPVLRPTNVLPMPASGRWDNQTPSGQNKLSPGPDRWKERSRTYQGIADAMAAQWGAISCIKPHRENGVLDLHFEAS